MLQSCLTVCPHVREKVPLSDLTTFRVGGPADLVARPETAEQAARLIDIAQKAQWPLFFLGKGSDVLAADDGFRGLILHTAGLTALSIDDHGRVTAGCGVGLPELARTAARMGFSGLEWAAGIPGTLGGGILLNAGAYGGQLSDVVQSVTVYNGDAIVESTDHSFGYRHSVYMENPRWFVMGATLQLRRDDPERIQERMTAHAHARREKQPLDLPSAGSFFKRPEGHFAGGLIEACGLKGYAVGGAQVSRKHAGFIVNTGRASCRDILRLSERIHNTVKRETGVALYPEVRLLGDIAWNF